ncbi:hypothetical protein [Paenibacillus spongiae]|uniref:Uncharacterized protein n=1 Tax=Paenibacillus spongiae TaxID=2909671 RepID=A0ABY5SDL8_9BACL|nr:hypothetical protein [Paenibacillus spongiae]UVI30867.1 hypothetical protein L1F29_03040 [Paenibacillus spongiae]
MKSQVYSSIRFISSVLIALFMLFATPTPIPETIINEATRTIVSPTVESIVKPHVRTGSVITAKMKLTAMAAVFSFLVLAAYRFSGVTYVPRACYRPTIARRLRRLKLAPVKYTSLFVSSSFLLAR